MLAAAVVLTHRAGVLHRHAEQGVGERRLARTRRAENHQGLPRAEIRCEALPCQRVGGVDREQVDVCRHAPPQRRDARFEQAVGAGDHVGLGQHDHRQHLASLHERQVTLEPARVEVVVKAHHEQRGVDVADDRVAPAVGVAPHDARERWYARLDPELGVHVALGQHPVADRQRAVFISEGPYQPGQRTRAVFAPSVVHAHGFAVHFGEPHQLS